MARCRFWTRHAEVRASQRAIGAGHVDLAIVHGFLICQGNGCMVFHLGRKETAAARLHGIDVPERAVGTAVVLAADGRILTVFRTHDRHRLKTRFPKRKHRWSTQLRHWLRWGSSRASSPVADAPPGRAANGRCPAPAALAALPAAAHPGS
jgi:hypothetical protein